MPTMRHEPNIDTTAPEHINELRARVRDVLLMLTPEEREQLLSDFSRERDRAGAPRPEPSSR